VTSVRPDLRAVEADAAGPTRTAPARLPYALYLLAAIALLSPLWRDPANRVLAHNYKDQIFFEWVLTNAAHALVHLDNPLFTTKLNAPYGLNLLANTSILGLALPLAPLTLLAGPHVTFAALVTLALAGTAAAWCFVLDKLLQHRRAAAIGGAWCGFAPAMISHATGHPNIAGQYVVPFLVWAVLRLREPGPAVRRGLVLAALVVVQAFINEEVLFLTALALGVFVAGYAAVRPRELAHRVPDALKTLATTALAAGATLAYPLYHQFLGPQHYRGLPADVLGYGSDLAAFVAFARRSVAGDAAAVAGLVSGPTEENTFFGWPLLLVLVAVVVWLRSDPVVRALGGTAAAFSVLSLGSRIHLAGDDTGVPGPWALLDELPLFDSVVPSRLALVLTPLFGCLIARYLAGLDPADRGRASWRSLRSRGPRGSSLASSLVAALLSPDASPRGRASWRSLRSPGRATAVLVLAVLPVVPTPLPAAERPPVPAFFATGTYREHIPEGGVVLVLPPGWSTGQHAMQWQTAAHHEFAIFGGYFLAPDPEDPRRRARFGPAYPPTVQLLAAVAETGVVPAVTDGQRAQARTELRFLHAVAVVLAVDEPRADAVRAAADQLFGPGVRVRDVWLWKV